MSSEPAEVRKQKCIVELRVGPFETASQAIAFGKHCDNHVKKKLDAKFRYCISALDTVLLITPEYADKTMIVLSFLDVKGQNDANFICESVKKLAKVPFTPSIRAKPQPQFIGAI